MCILLVCGSCFEGKQLVERMTGWQWREVQVRQWHQERPLWESDRGLRMNRHWSGTAQGKSVPGWGNMWDGSKVRGWEKTSSGFLPISLRTEATSSSHPQHSAMRNSPWPFQPNAMVSFSLSDLTPYFLPLYSLWKSHICPLPLLKHARQVSTSGPLHLPFPGWRFYCQGAAGITSHFLLVFYSQTSL